MRSKMNAWVQVTHEGQVSWLLTIDAITVDTPAFSLQWFKQDRELYSSYVKVCVVNSREKGARKKQNSSC